MKINQYACISLTSDYQKKGDNPESKDQWIILNQAQCIKNKLLEYEPTIGPGKFDKQNTENQFNVSGLQSSQLLTIVNDKLLVAFKNQILQYECIAELFSVEKCGTCSPQFKYNVQGDIIGLYSNQNQLIVQTKQAIVLYKSNNQNFTQQKIYNYLDVKQLNIDNNQLFLCLKDKLVLINLINLTESILKTDNSIQSGFYRGSEYFYICQGSQTIKSNQKEIKLTFSQDIKVKQIFVVDKFICVCGYETKYEPMDDEDDEPATYSAHIQWFDMTSFQPIPSVIKLEIDLIADTICDGDFGIKKISDLWLVFGSNLRQTTFWKIDNFCNRAKRFENSDEMLELLQHTELRGLTIHNFSKFIGFGMNQKTFRCIKRNPNICIFDKKGGLNIYEFFNFKQLLEYEQEQSNISQIINLNQSTLQPSNIFSKIFLKEYKSIRYTVIESDPREITKLINPPFNLQLQTKNNDSQLILGSGQIDYNFSLNQIQIPSANLIVEYQEYQIIGHQRDLLILNPKSIQNILQQQNHNIITHKITKNSNESILGVYIFQNQILVQTNLSLYLVQQKDGIWINQLLLQQNNIKRIQILKDYILVQLSYQLNQILIYQKQSLKDNLELIIEQKGEAGCLFEINNSISLLFIQDEQLFFLKNFITNQLVQTDIKIEYSKEYFIAQLHENHIYIAFATLEDYNYQSYILNYNIDLNEANQEQHLSDVLNSFNVNDCQTQMIESDWNITYITTQLAKLIFIIPNGLQSGFVLQVCGNDLRTIDNESNEPITIPCYSNIIRGISTLNTLLPSEVKLSSTPGFCNAKYESQDLQYKLQPSILLYEYDENKTLTIHRYLLIQLDGFQDDDKKPILKPYVEKQEIPKVQGKQSPALISQTESQKSLQPPPSPQGSNLLQPTKIAITTQKFLDLCLQAQNQINGEKDESLTYKPYFSMFTNQNIFDELQSKYFQIHNRRCKMMQQIHDSSVVADFCLLRKSFEIPKFSFSYHDIERTLSKLVEVKEQFSWICNFVIQTLIMNPFQRNKITFGEFQLPSISHIQLSNSKFISPNKSRIGRRIVFSEFSQTPEPKTQIDERSVFIQKLCAGTKSKVKYFQLQSENRSEGNDLNFQNIAVSVTSFGVQSQRLLKPPQISGLDEISEDEQNQTESIAFPNQGKSDKSSLQNNKGLSRTKGGLLNDGLSGPQPASKNPLNSDSSIPQKIMVESVLFDKKDLSIQSNNKSKKDAGGLFAYFEQQQKQSQKQEEKKVETGTFLSLNNTGSGGIFGNTSGGLLKETANQQTSIFAQEKKSLTQQATSELNQQLSGLILQPPKEKPKQELPKQEHVQIQAQKKTEMPTTTLFGQGNQDNSKNSLFSNLSASQNNPFGGLNLNQPKTEPPKQEPPKQEPPKQEPPKQEPPKQEPPKETPKQQDPPSMLFGLPKETPKQQDPPSMLFGLSKETPKPQEPATSQPAPPKQEPPKEAPKPQDVASASIFGAPKQDSSSIFGNATGGSNLFSGFTMQQQTTSDFLGIKTDTNQTPKKETKKPETAQENNAFSILNPKPQENTTQAQQGNQGLLFSNQNSQLQFTNFTTNTSGSIFQQQPQQQQSFLGMQTIGLAQPSQGLGTFNINQSSFGAQSSIFDQPQLQQAPQQKITFTGLQSQAQGQGLPNSIGGLLGQNSQAGFLTTNTGFNLGFDPTSEKPRK